MDIIYLGHSSFKLKGKSATLVSDPYDEKCGKFPKDTEADIVTISHGHGDHNAVDKIQGQSFRISEPGEYEVKGVSIIGVATWHDDKQGAERGENTVFVIEIDGLRIAHLGDLGHKLTSEQLEEMGGIDIAIVPVGGVYTVDAAQAVDVVRQLDPWIVIPMHYQQPGLDQVAFSKLTPVDNFIKEIGIAVPQLLPKLAVTAEKLPTELQVVVLERK